MNDYSEFQAVQKAHEQTANEKYETTGLFVHWLFLVVGALVSAGASFYIGHRGLAGNPFYERFFGSRNAAFLVVALLDGTFLALNLGLASFLKSEKQRQLARVALVVVKIILCVNIFAAFLMVQAAETMPWISLYVTYGSPFVIGGVIWLWSELFSHRRKNQMMAAALDVQAQRDAMWAKQYLLDQHRSRAAYDLASNSPQMAELRNRVARQKAIADIAAQFSLPTEEAERLFNLIEQDRLLRANGGSQLPTRAAGEPQHPSQPSRNLVN